VLSAALKKAITKAREGQAYNAEAITAVVKGIKEMDLENDKNDHKKQPNIVLIGP